MQTVKPSTEDSGRLGLETPSSSLPADGAGGFFQGPEQLQDRGWLFGVMLDLQQQSSLNALNALTGHI